MLRFACLTALFVSPGAFAQDSASLPRFEVASVKLNTSGATGSSNDLRGPTVVFRNYPFRGIIQTAFSVHKPAHIDARPFLPYDVRNNERIFSERA